LLLRAFRPSRKIGGFLGLGMIEFAIIATISIAIILYTLRSLDIAKKIKNKK
jgi:uncharacterized membrane protein YhiD involved in acid resistance